MGFLDKLKAKFHKDDKATTDGAATGGEKSLAIYAPTDGKIIELSEVQDDVFKQGMMGEGFAIAPTNGEFHTPMRGTLSMVFEPSKHAYGITNNQLGEEVECMMHIGLDTVELNGEGFDMKAEKGAELSFEQADDKHVKKQTALVTVDLEKIKAKAPSDITPIVFPKLKEQKDLSLEVVHYGEVKRGDLVAVIKRK